MVGPIWNNWGGLNAHVVRNQEFTNGLDELQSILLVGILGNTNSLT